MSSQKAVNLPMSQYCESRKTCNRNASNTHNRVQHDSDHIITSDRFSEMNHHNALGCDAAVSVIFFDVFVLLCRFL